MALKLFTFKKNTFARAVLACSMKSITYCLWLLRDALSLLVGTSGFN